MSSCCLDFTLFVCKDALLPLYGAQQVLKMLIKPLYFIDIDQFIGTVKTSAERLVLLFQLMQFRLFRRKLSQEERKPVLCFILFPPLQVQKALNRASHAVPSKS